MLPIIIKKTNQNNLLDEFMNANYYPNYYCSNYGSTSQEFKPKVNLKEDKDNFYIDIAAPGFNKENFSIQVEKDLLIIKLNKEEEKENTEEVKFLRKEFGFETFEKKFRLPELVDSEKIKAEYVSGILQVEIPKKEEEKIKPKSIEIS